MAETWWLYMIECRGGGIYTGIAKDVAVRYRQHVAGKGAKYTKLNPPVALLSSCSFPSHREAAQEEWRIKGMTPLEKRRWAFAMGGCPGSDNRFNAVDCEAV
ncbi:MAG: GIY-YIG nuclease family protein [Desulfuromonadaceae bacterium]|nr:GIY-YIG nuclease family protein [Desulfuromonadaceae bacterium]